jgi:hypothetical protein
MTTRATGTFEIDSWDEEPYDELEGTKLARVRVAKTFSGDVEGVSTTDLLLAYGARKGPRPTWASSAWWAASMAGPAASSCTTRRRARPTDGRRRGASCLTPGSAGCWACAGRVRVSVSIDGGHSSSLDYDLA